MATWVGMLVETRDRSDFWQVAARFNVVPVCRARPAHVLVDCGAEFGRVMKLAKELSGALQATVIGFVVQTTADVHQLHAFRAGELVRQLDFNRDGGGWVEVSGEPQPWERAYFFGDAGERADGRSDLLDDEVSSDERERYEAARRSGDATGVLDLLNPSSTLPLIRVCALLGVDPHAPGAQWRKRAIALESTHPARAITRGPALAMG